MAEEAMKAEQIKIFLISSQPEEKSSLLEMVAGIDTIALGGDAQSLEEALSLMRVSNTDLIMVSAGSAGDGYNIAARLSRLKPPRPIILVESELTRANRRRALSSGAADLVTFPYDFSQLIPVVYQAAGKKPTTEAAPGPQGKVSEGEPPPQEQVSRVEPPSRPAVENDGSSPQKIAGPKVTADAEPIIYTRKQNRAYSQDDRSVSTKASAGPLRTGKKGRLLTFFSSKGGVGKTFCSVNLAVLLALHYDYRVALVDLDLDYGSAALTLNIETDRSLIDLFKKYGSAEAALLESYLVEHSSGLRILTGGSPETEKYHLNRNQLQQALTELLYLYDYVVIDMPTRISGFLIPALDLADLLFAITTPDIAGVRNIRLFLKLLYGIGYPHQRIRVLLNREDSRTGIGPVDVEIALKERLYTIIPADYKRATLSLNRGLPLIKLYPRSKVAKAFHRLARKVVEKE